MRSVFAAIHASSSGRRSANISTHRSDSGSITPELDAMALEDDAGSTIGSNDSVVIGRAARIS
jgi:hypothetical protein